MTVRRLIGELSHRHGERLRSMLSIETGQPHPSLLLFLGDEQVRSDSSKSLFDGAEVGMFSPIAGG